MSIVKMKKLSLIARRDDREALLRDLMLFGCVELTEPEDVTSDPELAPLLKTDGGTLSESVRQLEAVNAGLEVIRKYGCVKSRLFARRPVMTEAELLDDSGLSAQLENAAELVRLDKEIRAASSERVRLFDALRSLEPWRSHDVPLDYAGSAHTQALIGTASRGVKLESMNAALLAKVPCAEVILVSESKEQNCLWLITAAGDMSAALDVLRPMGFNPSQNRTLSGTAAQNIARLESEVLKVESRINDYEAKINTIAASRADMRKAADLLQTRVDRLNAAGSVLMSDSALCITGWYPVPEERKLITILEKYGCAYDLTLPKEEEIPDVPIALKNNFLTRPLMMVTEMYSLPSYDGVDPNPLMMPWFCLFFGIMFADMGYGALLLLAGIFGSILMKPRGTMKYMMGLLKLCGITTILCGFLFGSFFADSIPVLSDMLGITHKELWSLINPIEEPMTALIGSLAIGALHLICGMAIKAVMLIREGKPLDALFDVGSWWLLFAGLGVGALGKGWWLAIAGALALVLTQGRGKPTIIGKLVGGLASLYDITSYLGDVLSYARLMAIMLAGSVVGSVVNVLGSMTGSIITFFVVFLVGHLFNIGINIIGTYVHAARLQYLEYFGKFYKDGGKPFRPLRVKTKFVEVIKEEM